MPSRTHRPFTSSLWAPPILLCIRKGSVSGSNRHRLREATVLNSKLVGFPWTQILTTILFQPLGVQLSSFACKLERALALSLDYSLGALPWLCHRQGEGRWKKERWVRHIHHQLYLSMVCSLWAGALASLSLVALQMLKILVGEGHGPARKVPLYKSLVHQKS